MSSSTPIHTVGATVVVICFVETDARLVPVMSRTVKAIEAYALQSCNGDDVVACSHLNKTYMEQGCSIAKTVAEFQRMELIPTCKPRGAKKKAPE
jgi:hypothetical protein